MCVRERESERERKKENEREREREREEESTPTGLMCSVEFCLHLGSRDTQSVLPEV